MRHLKAKEMKRVMQERRLQVCDRLRLWPGTTATDLVRQGSWGPVWGERASYGMVYHVLRNLVAEGVVVEDLSQGPAYWLAPGIGRRLAVEAVHGLKELLPDWAGLAGIREELRAHLVRRISEGQVR